MTLDRAMLDCTMDNRWVLGDRTCSASKIKLSVQVLVQQIDPVDVGATHSLVFTVSTFLSCSSL